MDESNSVKQWYEKSYLQLGFKAQRLYPNEELLRFFGRNFFSIEHKNRKKIKVLEVGCGSCSNLWMIAHEGFDTYGIDLSEESIRLGKLMLEHWQVVADLQVGNMQSMPYNDASMDVIIDVVSSCCLNKAIFEVYINEAIRVLKKNGRLFIYTPSVDSDAFKNYHPAIKLDDYTLNGIYRETSPYYGNFYTMRFEDVDKLSRQLTEKGCILESCETITRTYRKMQEQFQFISLDAKLNG